MDNVFSSVIIIQPKLVMVGSNLQRKVALRGILTIQIYLMPKRLQK